MLLRSIYCTFLLVLSQTSFSQQLARPLPYQIAALPAWAQEMYQDTPNLFAVDSLYTAYYNSHIFKKTYHTQYYKHWRKKAAAFIDDAGFVTFPTMETIVAEDRAYRQKIRDLQSSGQRNPEAYWTPVGPFYSIQSNGEAGHDQANIYSIDFCAAMPDVMYCGTEPGEVFKSVNGGDFWEPVSLGENFSSGITAVKVHPVYPDIVFAGSYYHIKKSVDGGSTWTEVISANLGVNEILIHSNDPQIMLAACDGGLYRSQDGGDTWSMISPDRSYDVKANTGNPDILYLVKRNPSLNICEFLISTDLGLTWTAQSNGWFASTDPDRNDEGARIGVTPADPNRVYAYLIGQAKDGDMGFIGVLRSNDGGQSWSLPNPPFGGPYSNDHPNLGAINPVSGDYWQGFYNCAIMVSATDPDKILVGGLNLWRSNDGGTTFAPLGGYQGNQIPIHVDMQDFRALGNTYWITTDGGVYRSTDFFQEAANSVRKSDGLRASDFWGFGSGWNEDVLVGGLYHNGNLGHHENYGASAFMTLGGGEAPTGYVNPGFNRKTYYSDINGCLMPASVPGSLSYFSFGIDPNESYYAGESSELEFHPDCYNIAFTGKENKLWKTTDGGTSFTLLYAFGTNINSKVFQIEISRNNPDIMYVTQSPSGSVGKLWKTTDGGITWTLLSIPAGNSHLLQISLNPLNDEELWMAYVQGGNGGKVFKTSDSGANWTNLTTSTLNGESVHHILMIAETDGGVYVFTNNTVYYRNNTMSDWTLANQGLPANIATQSSRPFYRDNKIRMATYGKGIWESDMIDVPGAPVAKAMVDKLVQTVICDVDSFYFEDYSMLNHNGATWNWTFESGSPATSDQRNPVVYFSQPGTYLATLTITDGSGQTDMDSIYVSVENYAIPSTIQEDFQANFPPSGFSIANEDGGGQWSLNTGQGGYGQSTQCAFFDNYYNDSQGTFDDIRMSLNLGEVGNTKVTYAIAYTPYGNPYFDTLAILVSTDCGATFEEIYRKGGVELSTTAPTTDYYEPADDEWRTDTIDLVAYEGNEHILVAFRNIGHYGNVMYIDNINIVQDTVATALPDIAEQQLTIYPNPVSRQGNIFIQNPLNETVSASLYDTGGKLVFREVSVNGDVINLGNYALSSGVYFLRLRSETKIYHHRVVVE